MLNHFTFNFYIYAIDYYHRFIIRQALQSLLLVLNFLTQNSGT